MGGDNENLQHERENIGFALLMILVCLSNLIEGAAIYLAKYSLGSSKTLIPLVEEVNRVPTTEICKVGFQILGVYRVVKRYELETRAV
jgi:hypothetical protein